jgi:hypothetical protein
VKGKIDRSTRFLPLDHPGGVVKHGILWALRHYSVPSAFLDERLRSVTHSYGAQSDLCGGNCASRTSLHEFTYI